MLVCKECNSPVSNKSDKICSACGKPLVLAEITNSGTLSAPRNRAGSGTVIFVTSALLVALLAILGYLAFTQSRFGHDDRDQMKSMDHDSHHPDFGRAQSVTDELMDNGICRSIWSADQYVKTPSFSIEPKHWINGDVRVCTIGTTEAPANDITVITGPELLATYGKTWTAPAGFMAITKDDWTIVLDSSQAKPSSKSDSVAQQIIAQLGGTLQASK